MNRPNRWMLMLAALPPALFLALSLALLPALAPAPAAGQDAAPARRPAANALRPPRATNVTSLPVEKLKPIGKVDADAQAVTPRPGGRGVIVIDRNGKLTGNARKQPADGGHVVPENARATVVGISPAGLTAIGTSDGKLNLVRTDTHRPVRTLIITGDTALGPLKFSPDGKRLMALGSDGVLHRWQVSNGHEQTADLSELGASAPVDFSPRGGYLVAANDSGQTPGLALWDVGQRKQLHALAESRHEYALVAISDDERWVAAVQKDLPDHIDLWRADTGHYLGVLRAAGGVKHSLRFSNTGDQLLVFDEEGQGVVLNVPSGVDVQRFQAEKPKTGVRTMIAPDLGVTQYADGEVTSIAPPPPPPPAPRIVASIARDRAMAPPPTAEPAAAEPQAAEVPEPGEPAPAEPAPTESAEPAPSEPSVSEPGPAPTAAPPGPVEPEMDEPETEGPATEEPSAAAPDDEPVTRGMDEASGESAPAAPTSAAPPKKDDSVVTVNYATNRNRLQSRDREWLVYFKGFFGSLPAFVIYALVVLALLILPWFGKRSWAMATVFGGAVMLCAMGALEAQVRSKLRDEMSGELFGCRPTDLSYGTCEISVPKPENRQAGEVNRPFSVWIFEAPENPEKHFMLKHVEEYPNKDAFFGSLQKQIAESESGSALLFIHGYNVSFEDALFRTAQLAVDLKFPGAPISYCWPSCADPVKYTFDEQNAEVSIPALREFLQDLALRSGAKRVHIIAHSMGNRVLAGALRNLDPKALAPNPQIFQEIVLAAPDIDYRVFKTQVLPQIASVGSHCTLYTSSRDRALLASRAFHNFQRLGETEPELFVASGIETIDATMVDSSLLGHSYIGDARSIVSDLHALLVTGKRPGERMGLETLKRGELNYWTIKP